MPVGLGKVFVRGGDAVVINLFLLVEGLALGCVDALKFRAGVRVAQQDAQRVTDLVQQRAADAGLRGGDEDRPRARHRRHLRRPV